MDPLDPQANLERTYVYFCVFLGSFLFPDFFDPLSCGRFELKSETLTCVLLTRRVTTADLASPETEVPPALR